MISQPSIPRLLESIRDELGDLHGHGVCGELRGTRRGRVALPGLSVLRVEAELPAEWLPVVTHQPPALSPDEATLYVANSDPDGIDHGLESKSLLAFAVCYVTAHYVLDMIDAGEAETVLDYCDQNMD